jgi:hypothetical protein
MTDPEVDLTPVNGAAQGLADVHFRVHHPDIGAEDDG